MGDGLATRSESAVAVDAAAPAPVPVPVHERIRMVVRLILAFVWTFPLLVVRVCGRTLERVAPEYERGLRAWIMKVWSRGMLRLLGVRLTVKGTPPSGHYYLVSNHMSYLDIPLFASHLGCVFVAMSEMASWPLVGFVARNMNTIFIDRKDWREVQRVNEVIGTALNESHSVMVFPESTTSYGHDVLPFRPALLEAAVAAGMPVHFATLRYHRTSTCPNPDQEVCWVDDVPFVAHAFRLLRIGRIDATIVFGAAPVGAADRKMLARDLERVVREQVVAFEEEAGRSPSGAA